MSLRNRVLIGWKIWFGDGTVLNSKFNLWEKCKQENVQVVKMFYKSDDGIEANIHHNQEYYLLDDLLKIPPQIKTGKGIKREVFDDILEAATRDQQEIKDMI